MSNFINILFWEQRKLGDIASFENGRAFKQKELLDQGKYPVLRVGNFYTNSKWYYSNLELSENKYANKGDLLYTWSATFGPHIWRGKKVIYHYHIWNIKFKGTLLNKLFLLYFLDFDKSQLLSNTNGSTMIHVTKTNMENKRITFPNVNEQTQIGNILKKLNNLISLQQRKSYLCKCINQAINQQLFLKKDSWEKAILHKLVHIEDNKRIPVKESMRKKGLIPYYGANGIQDYVQGFTHNGKFILIAEDGANSLTNYPVIQVNGKIWVNNHSHVLQPDNRQVDINFLTLALKLINYQKYVVGGSRTKLNLEDLKNIIIYLPPLDLQNKIGNFYNQQKIQNKYLNNQILQLKHIKQFLLQNMFI